MNKYEKFYRSKTVIELLTQLLEHKQEMHTMDKDWYDALIIYLNSLNLQGAAGALYTRILPMDAFALNAASAGIKEQLAALKNREDTEHPMVIEPRLIAEAGATIKVLVYIIIGFILLVQVPIIIATHPDIGYSTRTSMYGLIMIGGLLFSAVMLGLLYSVGNKLNKSVS